MEDFYSIIKNWQDKFTELSKAHTDLIDANIALNTRVIELENLVKYYEERLRLAAYKKFGRSSEKSNMDQLNLFNEAETETEYTIIETEADEEYTIKVKRKKRIGKKNEDFSGLPVEVIEYTLPETEQDCPNCGNPLHRLKIIIHRELKITPAQVSVIENRQSVYACRNCENTGVSATIINAPMPMPLLLGSPASASSVAFIIAQKYVYAMPLYRQEKAFISAGFFLSRQTMANWIIDCAFRYFIAIYEKIKCDMLGQDILHADETTYRVLHETGKESKSTSYMWLYRTGVFSEHQVVLYEYKQDRTYANPSVFLADYQGFLHTDGFDGYHRLPSCIIVIGCWAHVRRKWNDAVIAAPKEKLIGSATEMGFAFITKLFFFEKEFSGLPPDKRYIKRLEKSKPLSDAFFAWLKTLNPAPKTALGVAVTYALNQQPYLENVFLDGRLEMTNNTAERSIRPVTVGRKNFLFSNTENGATASAIIYSIVLTAEANSLDAYEYIKFLLEMLPNTKTSGIDELLPWGAAIPDICRAKSRPGGYMAETCKNENPGAADKDRGA